MEENHLHCVEYDCGYNDPNAIQDNVVYIKAAAKLRFAQWGLCHLLLQQGQVNQQRKIWRV